MKPEYILNALNEIYNLADDMTHLAVSESKAACHRNTVLVLASEILDICHSTIAEVRYNMYENQDNIEKESNEENNSNDK